jgi:hypothetical protein
VLTSKLEGIQEHDYAGRFIPMQFWYMVHNCDDEHCGELAPDRQNQLQDERMEEDT